MRHILMINLIVKRLEAKKIKDDILYEVNFCDTFLTYANLAFSWDKYIINFRYCIRTAFEYAFS